MFPIFAPSSSILYKTQFHCDLLSNNQYGYYLSRLLPSYTHHQYHHLNPPTPSRLPLIRPCSVVAVAVKRNDDNNNNIIIIMIIISVGVCINMSVQRMDAFHIYVGLYIILIRLLNGGNN